MVSPSLLLTAFNIFKNDQAFILILQSSLVRKKEYLY